MEAGSKKIERKTNNRVLGRGRYPDELPCQVFIKSRTAFFIITQSIRCQLIAVQKAVKLPFGVSSNICSSLVLRSSFIRSVANCSCLEIEPQSFVVPVWSIYSYNFLKRFAEGFINLSCRMSGFNNSRFSSRYIPGAPTCQEDCLYLTRIVQHNHRSLPFNKGSE